MSNDFSIIENKLHPKVRLNGICPYFTMFPLAFPHQILRKAKKNDLIYDPFCGRGTTNFAARLLGLKSYGVDSNPLAFAVAQAKLINVKSSDIISRCELILNTISSDNVPEGEFWNLAYHSDTLVEICKLRTYFISLNNPDDIDIALRAIILGVLHGPKMKTQPSYLSNQMPRTFSTKPNYSINFWNKNSHTAQEVAVLNLIKRRAEYIFNDQTPIASEGKILFGDSRGIDINFENKFDWVITSPPYYGMSTYEQDQWLRNWFLGGPSAVNYSTEMQLKHGSESIFINDLAKVWKNTSLKCNPNSKLVIRFGALPSKSKRTPSDLIKESFKVSDSGWKLKTIRSAGEPTDSKRQANQFRNTNEDYVKEIDVYATLDI